jgi:hypothetical protein
VRDAEARRASACLHLHSPRGPGLRLAHGGGEVARPLARLLLARRLRGRAPPPQRLAAAALDRGGGAVAAAQLLGLAALQSKRLLIESRWVSKSLAFAGELRPRRLNN